LAQLGLITIWAAVVACNPLLRFTAPVLGVLTCWFLLASVLPWSGGEQASAGWAFALVVQVFTVFVPSGCYRLWLRRAANLHGDRDQAADSVLSLSIQAMVLWMTAFAIAFGFVRYGQQNWHWQISFLHWEHMRAMPLIGIINGLLAGVWLWCVGARSRTLSLYSRVPIAIACLLALTFLQSLMGNWLTGSISIELFESMLILLPQSVVLSVSLAIASGSLTRVSQTSHANPTLSSSLDSIC
ncbi:MAG: hypothetical protein AAGE92_15230, partial [Cyanobacteria bacterium P01_G01_bin.4]